MCLAWLHSCSMVLNWQSSLKQSCTWSFQTFLKHFLNISWMRTSWICSNLIPEIKFLTSSKLESTNSTSSSCARASLTSFEEQAPLLFFSSYRLFTKFRDPIKFDRLWPVLFKSIFLFSHSMIIFWAFSSSKAVNLSF